MLNKFFVVALVATISMAAAGPSKFSSKTADMSMLMKQKKIFDLLMFFGTNTLPDAEFFEVGRKFDIMSNMEKFSHPEFVMNFMARFRMGFLSKDATFTFYNQEHREEMMMLFRMFFFAKDFSTFYKTACWARLNMNEDMFMSAFTTAVMFREDTKFMRLPAIYEIAPNMFFDSKIIREAQRVMMTHGMSSMMGPQFDPLKTGSMMNNMETFNVFMNNTDMCMSPMFNSENQLGYFMQDVGLNAFYFYFRMMMPFWMNTKQFNVPSSMRGEMYFFMHQQLMARYNLERMSNGMGEMEDFSWDKMDLPGFQMSFMFNNGVAMPRRDWWNFIPMYKMNYLEYLKKLEFRIMEAIDSGIMIDENGKQISLMNPQGVNMLGNMIEGNLDSMNLKFYGSYDALARKILGMNLDSMNKNFYVPSSLEFFSTSMKDPAFYRLYNRIVQYFLRFKSHFNRYSMNELAFPGVKIENVEVDKLFTFWDFKDFMINNAIDVPTMKDGQSFTMKAWQYFLNHKQFNYKFAINSDKSTKGVMRIFLGPAMQGMNKDQYSFFMNNFQNFFMLDEFEVNLQQGMNSFMRKSTDSMFFKNEFMNGKQFYQKMLQALEGKEPMTFQDNMWGFPEHLMLPKGTPEGMKFKMFFFISPFEDSKVIEWPFLGKRMFYGKPLGFPLDRPMNPWFFQLGNAFFKDVFIFNMENQDMMMSGMNSMSGNMMGSMSPFMNFPETMNTSDQEMMMSMGNMKMNKMKMDQMKMDQMKNMNFGNQESFGEQMGMNDDMDMGMNMKDFNMMHL